MKLRSLLISKTITVFCPISTLMYLWAIYILPGLVCLFGCSPIADRSREYRNPLQIHECRNWEPGRAVLFLEKHKSEFRYRVDPYWGEWHYSYSEFDLNHNMSMQFHKGTLPDHITCTPPCKPQAKLLYVKCINTCVWNIKSKRMALAAKYLKVKKKSLQYFLWALILFLIVEWLLSMLCAVIPWN
jgi:hypothetical protein